MECHAAPWVAERLSQQLHEVYATQTAPFVAVFQDYMEGLQRQRELEVRLTQLDKETAELRDENVELHQKLKRLEEYAAHDYSAQAQTLGAKVSDLERELAGLYKDKSRLLEEVVAAGTEASTARKEKGELVKRLEQAAAAVSQREERVRILEDALAMESRVREATANEMAGAMKLREDAQAEAEQLRLENSHLVRRLVDLKENEVKRMNEMNILHEELLAHTVRVRREEAEVAERSASTGGASAAGSLKHTLSAALSEGIAADKLLPKAPVRSLVAHKGGACSLAMQPQGHLLASCGADRPVSLWDIAVLDLVSTPTASLAGMLGSVNDVTFTCDGQQVLAAGTDKSLIVWDVRTGQPRHTLTGHTAAVTCVSASRLDSRCAVSTSDDRSMKLWDLSRGFSIRSMLCVRMPSSLLTSRDGNTIITGHLDGSLSLWDVRSCRMGTSNKPFGEMRDGNTAVAGLAYTNSETLIVAAGRDNVIRVWDFRDMSGTPLKTIRNLQFNLGTFGSGGKGRCHLEVSPQGRLAVGAVDGSIYLWDLNGEPGRERMDILRWHKDAVIAVAWSQDASVLASADKAGVLGFWHIP